MNTASNLEHRMKVIMKNAGLEDVKGGLHIFRKTFATKMYELSLIQISEHTRQQAIS